MFMQKLRQFISHSEASGNDWVVVFFDKNDFRLNAMKKRLVDHGIAARVEKSAAVYVHKSDLESAKTIVKEWVN